MTDDENLAEAEERWRNTDGFASSDELECFEDVYALAAAWMRSNEVADKDRPKKKRRN